MQKTKIILATDHAGFELKEDIKIFLQNEGFTIEDVGANEYKKNDDYPEYMVKAATTIATNPDGGMKAIIFGASGQGEAIVANRFPGIRAAVWYGGNTEVLRKSREHNDANVLSLGAHYIDKEQARDAVKIWLNTPFSNEERHARRIEEIDSIE